MVSESASETLVFVVIRDQSFGSLPNGADSVRSQILGHGHNGLRSSAPAW
jgi:hypothetical protein